jgi:hypothetical protein
MAKGFLFQAQVFQGSAEFDQAQRILAGVPNAQLV